MEKLAGGAPTLSIFRADNDDGTGFKVRDAPTFFGKGAAVRAPHVTVTVFKNGDKRERGKPGVRRNSERSMTGEIDPGV